MIKKTDCLQFLYDGRTNEEELDLHTKIQFAAQSPIDETLPERAILVKFRARGGDEKFEITCLCRVIFEFSGLGELVEEDELLRRYQADAYVAVTELINNLLITMGQNKMDFPEF